MYVSWTAGRLDRLHARVDAAWAGSTPRSSGGPPPPARSVPHLPPQAPATLALDRAAAAALRGGPVTREAVENELAAALRAALPLLPYAGSEQVREELDAAETRVGLARSFHNSAVANARAQRVKRVPRCCTWPATG